MANLTIEEKKKLIEEFVANNQKKCYYLKTLSKYFEYCSVQTLSTWTKSIYGIPGQEFFYDRGVLIHPEDYSDFVNKIFTELKTIYEGKEPAADIDELSEDNPNIPVEDFIFVLKKVDFEVLQLIDSGIIEDPYKDDDTIISRMEYMVKLYSGSRFLTFEKFLFEFAEDLEYELYGNSLYLRVFDRFSQLYGMTIEEFLIKNNIMLSEANAKKECEKIIKKLAEIYSNKKPEQSIYSIEWPSKKYLLKDVNGFYIEQGMKSGLNRGEAEKCAEQVFIDAGVVEGEKSANAIPVAQKDAPVKNDNSAKPSKVKANIYEDIDKVDTVKLFEKAGMSSNGDVEFPKDHKYPVSYEGKTFYVKFKLKKTLGRIENYTIFGFDAKEALLTMLSREDVLNNIYKADPNCGSDAYLYATEEFKEGFDFDEDLSECRILFLKAIGILLSNQKCADALVEIAPKKKNGTFYKGRIVRIASSMVAQYPNIVYEITGRTESDDTLSVAFEAAKASPDSYEKSCDDFISNNWNFFE